MVYLCTTKKMSAITFVQSNTFDIWLTPISLLRINNQTQSFKACLLLLYKVNTYKLQHITNIQNTV